MRWVDEPIESLVVIISRHRLASLHPFVRSGHVPLHHLEVSLPEEPARKKAKRGADPKLLAGLTMRQLRDLSTSDCRKAQLELIGRATDGMLTARWCSTPMEYVGGHEEIKAYLTNELLPVIKRRDKLAPKGILMQGPPGVGKSILAEAIATMLNEPLLEMLSPIRSSYVGENEDRMIRMLQVVKVMGGVMYFDEGDKMFSHMDGPQGDSGVQMRIQMSLHQAMGETDNRGNVLYLMATNRPYMLPASMRRTGRFDVVLPLFPPTTAIDRVRILGALCLRHEIEGTAECWEHVANRTQWWTGADLEGLVVALGRQGEVTMPRVREAVEYLRPSLPRPVMEEYIQLTQMECRDRRLIPASLGR